MDKKGKTILLLTGKSRDGKTEDNFLSDYLKHHFEIIFSDMSKAETLANKADLVLVRNIWPTSNKLNEYRQILSNLIKKRKKLYNPGIEEKDLTGKEYLVHLFKKGFPVIPAINEKADLELLGKTNYYFVKPKHGGSREGCKKVSKKDLAKIDFSRNVIQPFIDFKYEVSFYFIDNKLVYALYAPNKHKRWNLKLINLHYMKLVKSLEEQFFIKEEKITFLEINNQLSCHELHPCD